MKNEDEAIQTIEAGEPGKREWSSFWSLVAMQCTNAFNDSFAKFLLIPLGVALTNLSLAPKGIEHLLGLLMLLPFILFAPTAGWLGDRFSKSRVIQFSSWFQLAVLLFMGGSLYLGVIGSGWALTLVLIAFFLLATQSALLSPAKMGVVKELVGSQRLGFANGVMEGTVIVAILVGQIIGGVWFDKWGIQRGLGPWEAALIPMLWILIGGGLSLVLAHSIQTVKAQGAEKFSKSIPLRHFRDLQKVHKNEALWRTSLGIAFFWGFGGFLQFLLIQVAQEKRGSLAGMGVETALLWLPVVVGIVIGSVLASWICNRRNELGLIVVGGVFMTLGTFLLAFIGSDLGSWIFLGLAGFGGALFLVPLNAFLQDRAPEDERGLVLSASNLCNNFAGVFAVAFQFLLKALGVPTWLQFIIIAIICAAATIHVMRLLPKDFVRLLLLGFFRSFYKIRTLGVENIPEKGGVLLVANHISYIDAFVLSASCPRPIRFLMFADCFDKKWIGKGARFFDTVPISSTRARDAIKVAAEALEEGAVVCLFPEGQLSRTGGLSELKRGYQMIAKKANCPVLPAYMDGLWGSIWSFSENNFLRKFPRTLRYGVSVAFGRPMPPSSDLGEALRELSTLTVADREPQFLAKVHREPRLLGDLPRGWTAVLDRCRADDGNGREMRLNALQLSQVNLIHRNSRLLVEWIPDDDLSGILGILWPLAIGAKVSYLEKATDVQILSKVEGEELTCIALRGVIGRESLIRELAGRGVIVWSFDEVGLSDGDVFGCLVRDSRVLTYALPDPDAETTTQLPQRGWGGGNRGKLLPGYPQDTAGELDAEGFVTGSVTG